MMYEKVLLPVNSAKLLPLGPVVCNLALLQSYLITECTCWPTKLDGRGMRKINIEADLPVLHLPQTSMLAEKPEAARWHSCRCNAAMNNTLN